jgi:hypothetical protein
MMLVRPYLRDRFRTLRPANDAVVNPLKLLASLTGKQWACWLVSYIFCTWLLMLC